MARAWGQAWACGACTCMCMCMCMCACACVPHAAWGQHSSESPCAMAFRCDITGFACPLRANASNANRFAARSALDLGWVGRWALLPWRVPWRSLRRRGAGPRVPVNATLYSPRHICMPTRPDGQSHDDPGPGHSSGMSLPCEFRYSQTPSAIDTPTSKPSSVVPECEKPSETTHVKTNGHNSRQRQPM